MSNALAVAGVTAVLKDLLDNALIDHSVNATVGSPVTVSAMSPDRVTVGADEKPQLNLFMYHVQPNPAWRNAGLPSRDGQGQRLTNPPLALDLYYLLSAYGAHDFEAEVLLGYAMQMLHETPVLTRDAIRRALNPSGPLASPVTAGGLLPPLVAAIAASDLADQVEMIKLTPQSLDNEDMSHMWTAIGANYRPSVVYQVSVVLIQSRRPERSALPVLTRTIVALPFSPPQITAVDPQMPVVAPNLQITLRGVNLRSEDMVVRVGGFEVAPDPDASSDRQVVFTAPTGLRAGLNEAQVVHRVVLNTPPSRDIFESNPGVFLLRPLIGKNAGNNYDISFGDRVVNADGTRSGTVTVNLIQPAIDPTQQVRLLLSQLNPPPGQPPRTFRVDAPHRTADATSLAIPVRNIAVATYLVRLQVDGAESPLDVDGTGKFSGPTVDIP